MKKFLIYMVFAAVLAGFSNVVHAADQEQWLSYRTSPQANRVVGDMMTRSLEILTARPDQVELPEFTCDDPIFAKWNCPMVKGKFLWLALDRKNKNGNYDRIVIDSNGDGHLKDEKCIDAHQVDSRYSYFGPVPVYFEVEDEPIAYHLNFQWYYRQDYKRLSVSSGGWYEGIIRLGDRKMHCTLIDYNANGTFNDTSLRAPQSDRIRIGKTEHAPTRYVGKYLQLDDVLYQPTIATDGACITIAKANNVVFGNVKVPAGITELTTGGTNGQLTVTLENGLGKLPVGQYALDHWQIDRKDDNNRTWTMRGSGFGKNADFEITKDETAYLAIGEPVLARLETRKRGKQFSFSHQLQGQLKERIEITRNGNRIQAPKLLIVNGDQTYNRTFQLEYG